MVDTNNEIDLTGFREETAKEDSPKSERKRRRKKKPGSSSNHGENIAEDSDASGDGASSPRRAKGKNNSRNMKVERLSFQSADAFADERDSGHARTRSKINSPKKKLERRSFQSADGFVDEVDSGHKRTKRRNSSKRRNSIDSVNSRKKRDSISSIGSGGFLNRLDTSLVTSIDLSMDESQDFKVIDVEDVIELNREREMRREKMKKKIKNQRKNVDPRLFPSYYNDKSENSESNNEDDESSMWDFTGASYHTRRRNSSTKGSTRSNHQIVSAVQGRKLVQLSVILSPAGLKGGKAKEKREKFSKMLASSRTDGVVRGIRPHKDLATFSAPIDLLDIENGRAILVRGNGDKIRKSKISMSVAAVKQTMAPQESDALFLHTNDDAKNPSLRKRISNGDIRDFKAAKSELDRTARQKNLRIALVLSMDVINSLNFGRHIQLSIPFLTGYEAYLLGQIVEVLDSVVSSSDASKKTRRRIRRKAKVELNAILSFAFRNNNVSRIITEAIPSRWEFSSHLCQNVRRSRRYDVWGQLPIIGALKFPMTENFPPPEELINESMIEDPEKFITQHHSADCNVYGATNRNRFGTYVGRSKTNDFRIANRLPVDESILHSFVVAPIPTMVNNGVVHVLRLMANHWNKILEQPFGNLAHHRLEQIDPFETMRFHMPNVCIVLASLRGRNEWDSRVLAPFIRKCQILTTSFTAKECLNLAKEMQSTIVPELCSAVATIEAPLSKWLVAIKKSCKVIEDEAKEVYKEVTGVEIGLQFGYDLLTQVSWKLPSDDELVKALILHLQGKYAGEIVQERNIRKALFAITPRDKRTLIELVRLNIQESETGKILVGRVIYLLKRVIRREFLNDAIQELSRGEQVYQEDLITNDWYWLTDENDKKAVYIFQQEGIEESENLIYKFVHVDSGVEKSITFDEVEDMMCRRHVPVAASIVRAQRCYMNLEINFCNRFKYSAFAEFAFLRTALNRLAVVSQIFCEELDDARVNMLREIKASNQVKVEVEDLRVGNTYYIYNATYDIYAPFVCKKQFSPADPEWKKLEEVEMVKIPPQSAIVVGSGITGLMAVIHCTENVLFSGGEMKLYDTFDANSSSKGSSIFERAQIVRLDSRWVAMLRYHIGTAFEDTFIPTAIELNTQLAKTLTTQGFVEITIKDLECILHAEVTRLVSNDVIQVFTGNKMRYDAESNSMVKFGKNLEVGDKILRRVNPIGNPCKELHRWSIVDVQNAENVGVGDLGIGEEYDIYDEQENLVTPYKLIEVNLETKTYKFESLKKKTENIEVKAQDLPLVYPRGSKRHFKTVLVKCDTKGDSEDFHCDRLSKSLKGKKFIVDIGYNHVLECTGKPYASPNHFQVTTSEPYGFCCISRLNQSMRAEGSLDGFHSIHEQFNVFSNDSITVVRQLLIAQEMMTLIFTENWQLHFIKLIEDSRFPSLNEKDPIVKKLMEAVEWHSDHARSFRRQTLQIKISETIDNLYLAMELTREYEKWKFETVNQLLTPIENTKTDEEKEEEDSKLRQASKRKKLHIEELKVVLRYNIDVLWFEACLEVLRQSGVYNKGPLKKIERLRLINSHTVEELKNLNVGDNFRNSEKMKRKFEILFMSKTEVLARTTDGIIQKFDPELEVYREGCLSRSINGDTESQFAVASFPVSQYVNHRSMYHNNLFKGYVFAPIGEEQATSHFMHHTALSGGCIHAMQFDQFLRSTIDGAPIIDCLQSYAKKVNWSNGETIERVIMSSFGEDGFLRSGFSYRECLQYIHSQVIGANQKLDNFMSSGWKRILAASMIPRGMELNDEFTTALKEVTDQMIFDLFLQGVINDENISWSDELENTLKTRKLDISSLMSNNRNKTKQHTFWERFFGGLRTSLNDTAQKRLHIFHGGIAKSIEKWVREVIDFAKESHIYDQRSSQELWNQPRPVDSIIDDFAVDGRGLPNFLAQSAAFCTASVALALYASYRDDSGGKLFDIFGVLISVLNISLCFNALSKSKTYKVRNAQVRAIFFEKHFMDLKKALYSAMDEKYRKDYFEGNNPFLEDLEQKKIRFMEDVVYYGLHNPDEFIYDYSQLMKNLDQPDAFERFQKALVTYHILDVYQTNSYVQDSLVDLYKACDEFRKFLTQEANDLSREGRERIPHLFARVTKFGPRLEKSLDSRAMNSNFFLALRYFWSLQCCSWSSRDIKISSIESETLGIIKATRIVSKLCQGSILKRQIRDLEYLYRAQVETDKGSLVFMWIILIFIVSVIFVISRLVTLIIDRESALTTVGFWSQLTLVLPALLSLFYFLRCLGHQFGLLMKVGASKSATNLGKKNREGLRKIKAFIFIKFLMMTARICAMVASMIALSWCISASTLPEKLRTNDFVPLYIAIVAFFLELGTTFLDGLLEYTIAYKLPTKLGEPICESFRNEIDSMYKELSISENDLDSKQFQARIAWEYVAREFLHKYRFDIIFRSDRFGSILQYLQSGMQKKEDIDKGDCI